MPTHISPLALVQIHSAALLHCILIHLYLMFSPGYGSRSKHKKKDIKIISRLFHGRRK